MLSLLQAQRKLLGLKSSPTIFFFLHCHSCSAAPVLCYGTRSFARPLKSWMYHQAVSEVHTIPKKETLLPITPVSPNIFGVSFFNRILNKHNLGNQSKHNLFFISFCFFEMHWRRVAGIPLLRVKFRSQADSILYKFTLRFKKKSPLDILSYRNNLHSEMFMSNIKS